MTARVDVTAIDIDDSWEDILAVIENAHYTRIPVYEDSIDHVIGILHMNHFLKALTEGRPVDIRSLLLEPCYVYKTVRLPEVLAQLRRSRQHLAIVVDEYGGTLGVITMEDVLEEVVGEIWDETDMVEDEDIVRSAENEYVIDGDTPISDLLDLLNIREEEFDGESETVGGWTVERFGTFPKEGDSFAYRDYTVTVLEMDDLRVEKVRITKNETEKEE
jgi:CBS domain containing-hemolysin-like protein